MKTTVLVITAVMALAYAASAQVDNEFGLGAGNGTLTGSYNTGIGDGALELITSGWYNTANGFLALSSITYATWNTANGAYALYNNTSGKYNTANGANALYSNTNGNYNTANGYQALNDNTSGYANTANGYQALYDNTTGNTNIALGYGAGFNLTTGDNNIDIGNMGGTNDDAVIRIGTQGVHTNTFIAGISGVSVSGGAVVVVDSHGQLGTASAGSAVPQSAYLTLPTGTAAPAGYTLLGTTTMKYKYQVEAKGKTVTKSATIDADLYQKD
ncbi:MAG: hypothetical protein ACLPT4_06765 [Verrucomicrobiia bacterium]